MPDYGNYSVPGDKPLPQLPAAETAAQKEARLGKEIAILEKKTENAALSLISQKENEAAGKGLAIGGGLGVVTFGAITLKAAIIGAAVGGISVATGGIALGVVAAVALIGLAIFVISRHLKNKATSEGQEAQSQLIQKYEVLAGKRQEDLNSSKSPSKLESTSLEGVRSDPLSRLPPHPDAAKLRNPGKKTPPPPRSSHDLNELQGIDNRPAGPSKSEMKNLSFSDSIFDYQPPASELSESRSEPSGVRRYSISEAVIRNDDDEDAPSPPASELRRSRIDPSVEPPSSSKPSPPPSAGLYIRKADSGNMEDIDFGFEYQKNEQPDGDAEPPPGTLGPPPPFVEDDDEDGQVSSLPPTTFRDDSDEGDLEPPSTPPPTSSPPKTDSRWI